MKYLKLKLPTQVKFASVAGVLPTIEGDVAYQAGDALMTGIEGEHWPISRATFEATYEAVPPTKMGDTGTYVKKQVVVEAEQLEAPAEISIQAGKSMLKGKTGDWVVTSPDGSRWVVSDSIFKETYRLVNN